VEPINPEIHPPVIPLLYIDPIGAPSWVTPIVGSQSGEQMTLRNYRPAGRYALAFGQGTVTIELEVNDRADAFAQAQKLVKEGRPATLYEDGVSLGQISYSAAGFWTVSGEGALIA
jgi:hypothetical protein